MNILTEERILGTILSALGKIAATKFMDAPLDPDTNILEAGFDSFDFATLIPDIEEDLGIAIDLADADLSEVITISGLAAFIARQNASGAEQP
ncbi:acyl carrier protein [Fundidesulfovibrio soli]|uniref:acyl carrier protein n=1 Tax=Fundidesulfovibrio soli TaxID=2922716 RepID=UPI001FAF01DE|nr:acyl carrier protein [Fundidesulfovibrio soli]